MSNREKAIKAAERIAKDIEFFSRVNQPATGPAPTPEQVDVVNRLLGFDWHYQYSDDYRVHRVGDAEFDRLKQDCRILPCPDGWMSQQSVPLMIAEHFTGYAEKFNLRKSLMEIITDPVVKKNFLDAHASKGLEGVQALCLEHVEQLECAQAEVNEELDALPEYDYYISNGVIGGLGLDYSTYEHVKRQWGASFPSYLKGINVPQALHQGINEVLYRKGMGLYRVYEGQVTELIERAWQHLSIEIHRNERTLTDVSGSFTIVTWMMKSRGKSITVLESIKRNIVD